MITLGKVFVLRIFFSPGKHFRGDFSAVSLKPINGCMLSLHIWDTYLCLIFLRLNGFSATWTAMFQNWFMISFSLSYSLYPAKRIFLKPCVMFLRALTNTSMVTIFRYICRSVTSALIKELELHQSSIPLCYSHCYLNN